MAACTVRGSLPSGNIMLFLASLAFSMTLTRYTAGAIRSSGALFKASCRKFSLISDEIAATSLLFLIWLRALGTANKERSGEPLRCK